jgi:hypothetical protein
MNDSPFFFPANQHIDGKLTSSAFQRGVDLPHFLPNPIFFVTWRKKNFGYCKGTVVLHMQYPARVTNFPGFAALPRSGSEAV